MASPARRRRAAGRRRAAPRRRPRCRRPFCRRAPDRRPPAAPRATGQPQQARHRSGRSTRRSARRPTASESRQKRGTPPMAAMSLRPRASALWPTASGGCVRMAEMHVFEQHIGGEQQVFARARRTVNGAIVADTQYSGRAPAERAPGGGWLPRSLASPPSPRGRASDSSARFYNTLGLTARAAI